MALQQTNSRISNSCITSSSLMSRPDLSDPVSSSLNRSFYCSNNLLAEKYLNNEDIIKEFRHAFLEDYLEKNKIGRKSKSSIKIKPKFKHHSPAVCTTQAINIPQNSTWNETGNQKGFKNLKDSNQFSFSDNSTDYLVNESHQDSNNQQIKSRSDTKPISLFDTDFKDLSDLSNYLDHDLFSFNISPVLTGPSSSCQSEENSFCSPPLIEHHNMIFKEVDIEECMNSGEDSEEMKGLFETSSLMNQMKIYMNYGSLKNETAMTSTENEYLLDQNMSFQF